MRQCAEHAADAKPARHVQPSQADIRAGAKGYLASADRSVTTRMGAIRRLSDDGAGIDAGLMW
jgi:hypothetical protein